MQQVSVSEFSDWSANPVTKAFKLAIVDQIERIKEQLSITAGIKSEEDNYLRGYITSLRDTLEFRVEDLTDGD